MNFLDYLTDKFGGEVIGQIAAFLGIDREKALLALSQLIPIFTTALANNAASKEGSSSLFNAVENDHDGSIMSGLSSFITNYMTGKGSGILRHVLGEQTPEVAKFVGNNSGLNMAEVVSLMQIAAPMIMGMLGAQQKEKNLQEDQLSDMLKTSVTQVAKTDPKNMGMIGKLLDADGDGNVWDDVAGMGMSFLKNWMNGRSSQLK
ncbi:MAG: DUF937 domain-containing protein [Chitinophagales bacterium]